MSFFMFGICFWLALALVSFASPFVVLAARFAVAALASSSPDDDGAPSLSYDSAPMSCG